MNKRFICVEGVIGVGKTSLARRLAKVWNANLIEEIVEENPFLADFYKDRERYAFQTQMFFLLSRYKQLKKVSQMSLFNPVTVSDYAIYKDRIFATINLSDWELNLYNQVADVLEGTLPQPDYIIYLRATVSTLMKRIKKRNRPFERNMDREYIELLVEFYDKFFAHFDNCPLLIVETDNMDLVNDDNAFNSILNEIEHHNTGIKLFLREREI